MFYDESMFRPCHCVLAATLLAACAADSLVAQQSGDPRTSTGPYTTAQAARGRDVYVAHCGACHGSRLEGVNAPALVGTTFMRSWSAYGLTADELYFIIRTTMPLGDPGRLAPQEYVDAIAYLLQQNGYPAGTVELTNDRYALKQVKLVPTTGETPQVSSGGNKDEPPKPPPLTPTTSAPAQTELDHATDDANWLAPEHDYSGTKYAPLAQITRGNVKKLRAVCLYQVGDLENFQSMPIVYRGVMYVTTARLTIALDARTCRLRWKHEWPGQGVDNFPRNRGVAIKNGMVVRGTTDGNLIALDAVTGGLLWARQIADVAAGETFTMPPLIYDDLVVISPGVSEHGISGWVGAFRLKNGEPVWRFETIKDRTTWRGSDSIVVGGASVWTPFTLDQATGTLYGATANPVPDLAGQVRLGDNLYSNSVVAWDIRTGSMRWYRQLVPHDTHDWDLTHAGPLFSAKFGARLRNVVVTVGKDGVLRTLDRTTGEVLYETPVTRRENVDAPVTTTGTHACPGILGGVEWNGPAYNPRLGLLFVNAVDWCGTFKFSEEVRHVPGRSYLGGSVDADPIDQAAGWLTAIDGATGMVRWRYRSSAPLIGGLLTSAGDLVFTGELTGDFLALDARTGAVLYRFNTGGPIGGGVISYAVDGTQFVAVMSGRPSRFAAGRDPGAGTVLVFGLP